MPSKKKTNIDRFLEETRQPSAPKPTDKSLDIIRDLVAVIRANLPGREFVVVQKAERYLQEQENG